MIPFIAVILISFFYGCSPDVVRKSSYDYSKMDPKIIPAHIGVEEFIEANKRNKSELNLSVNARIENIEINEELKLMEIFLNKHFAEIPYREDNTSLIYSRLKEYLPEQYNNYDIKLYSLGKEISELIPNFYRKEKQKDITRQSKERERNIKPLIENAEKPFKINKGLRNKYIAIWHSHGWYYANAIDRWEWQRPRLFQGVEDKLPMSFTIPYIIPMLENAGASVFVPRERDVQLNEIVIDAEDISDIEQNNYYEIVGKDKWLTSEEAGFGKKVSVYKRFDNPFRMGNFKFIEGRKEKTAEAVYAPEFPENGFYSVYISYASLSNSSDNVEYTVKHLGGETKFLVNQTMGGGTWIHLGKFKFAEGKNSGYGSVTVSNLCEDENRIITTDAVKFGGGYGNVERGGSVSGRPRFIEGARYFLQYAGMPDTLVYDLNNDASDYKDDYQCRGEYANYLRGAPYGPNTDRNVKGLGIPIDLSIAFHTDAGITTNDTVIGTLAIYTLDAMDSSQSFPCGTSRFANRDFTDIIQTEIVNAVRKDFDPAWNRRQLRDAVYSESCRPNIPSMLLELLSHQNYLDMKFTWDPQFRFTVSRSIYKGVLKFLSEYLGFEYVVQPLPADNFSAQFDDDGAILLKWSPKIDPLEPTAIPEKYIVYTRIDDGDFNNGEISNTNEFKIKNFEKNKIYSFKITAVNEGGESFPSEILSVCSVENSPYTALIINGFDRVCGPGELNLDNYCGFSNLIDEGVPDKFDFLYTGAQIDYEPSSKFITNDMPGHGASGGESETMVIAGNTFDFPYIHGVSLKNNGVSFVSCSDESAINGAVDLKKFGFIDLILGEEKTTKWQRETNDSLSGLKFIAYPKELQAKIKEYLLSNGKIFISGAYAASDLFASGCEEDKAFAKDILKIQLGAVSAAKNGKVFCSDSSFVEKFWRFEYNSEFSDKIYKVENPDAVNPVNGSKTIVRYSENKYSAGTAYSGDYKTIVFGVPFETIAGQKVRDTLMKSILEF